MENQFVKFIKTTCTRRQLKNISESGVVANPIEGIESIDEANKLFYKFESEILALVAENSLCLRDYRQIKFFINDLVFLAVEIAVQQITHKS